MALYKNAFAIYLFLTFTSIPQSAYAVGGDGRIREGVQTLEEALLTTLFVIVVVGVTSLYSIRKAALAKTQGALWLSLLSLVLGMFVTITLFAEIYMRIGMFDDFLTSIYFSMVTWTTLGYGDFVPTNAARLYAAFEALIGYLYLGLFVSVFYRCLTFKTHSSD